MTRGGGDEGNNKEDGSDKGGGRGEEGDEEGGGKEGGTGGDKGAAENKGAKGGWGLAGLIGLTLHQMTGRLSVK